MIDKYDLTDQELDALIQDLSHKLAKAKVLSFSSEAFINLQQQLVELNHEQKRRYGIQTEGESGVAIEADPSMADIPFVPHTRKIDTF